MFRAGDEHFSAGDKHIENVRFNFSHTHTQLATSDSKQTLCRDDHDCYSHVLTSENGRYHALVLTSEYVTSTSYTYTIAFSAGLNGLFVILFFANYSQNCEIRKIYSP